MEQWNPGDLEEVRPDHVPRYLTRRVHTGYRSAHEQRGRADLGSRKLGGDRGSVDLRQSFDALLDPPV